MALVGAKASKKPSLYKLWYKIGPRVTKECFLEALKYLKTSKKHPFETPGYYKYFRKSVHAVVSSPTYSLLFGYKAIKKVWLKKVKPQKPQFLILFNHFSFCQRGVFASTWSFSATCCQVQAQPAATGECLEALRADARALASRRCHSAVGGPRGLGLLQPTLL